MGGTTVIDNSQAAIGTLNIQTSSYGSCIPWAFGTTRISPNIIQYEDFKSIPHTTRQGGKGGGVVQQNTTYTYTACLLMAICSGVISSVPKVWKDKSQSTLGGLAFDLYTGTNTQTPYPYMTTKHPTRALGYRGISYVASGAYDLGTQGVIGNHSFEVVTGVKISGLPDADVASVITAILTDNEQGLGMDAANIGDLTQFTNFCLANNIWVSPVYHEQKPAYEMLRNLLQIGFSDCFRSNGVLQIVPYSDVAASSAYGSFMPTSPTPLAITEDDIIGQTDDAIVMTRKMQKDSFNHVQVRFRDRTNDYNDDIAEAKDSADIAVYGIRSMPIIDMPEICDIATANKVADFIMHRSLNIRNEYEFRLPWKFARLEPMDLLAIYYPRKDHNGTPVLITNITEDESGVMTIQAEDYPLGTNHAVAKAPQTTGGFTPDNNIAPGNSTVPVIFEAPMQLTADVPQVWLATSGGANWGGCEVWVSTDNSTYEKVGIINQKARYGTTTSSITAGATTDTVNVLSVDINASGGSLSSGTNQNAQDLVTACYVGGEYLAYATAGLAGAGLYNLSYLVRGAYGSINGAHASGVPFVRLDGSTFAFPYPKDWVGKTIYVKLVSFNIFGGGIQDISTVSPTSYAIIGAPLGTVANLRSPTAWTYGKNVETLWDPLSGAVSYDVNIYQGATLVRSVTGIVDNSYTYTPQDMINDGGPWRAVSVYVRGRSLTNNVGAFANISLNNPQIGALSTVKMDAGINIGFFSVAPPVDLDFAGIILWVSTSSSCPAVTGNQVYDGPNTFVTVSKLGDGTTALAGGTTYYYRVAGYDNFGKDSLTTSAVFSFTPLANAPAMNSITAAMIQAGAVDITKFASGIDPVAIVSSLPTVSGYTGSPIVYLTTDGQLYRLNAGVWTAAVPTSGLTGQIVSTQITDGSITTPKLVANAVTANEIAANAVTTGKINAGAVTASQIAASAITADKLYIQSPGSALNGDPGFLDTTAWQVGSCAIATISDGSAGNNVMRSNAGASAFTIGQKFCPIDLLKIYRVRCKARRSSTANGVLYIGVQILDSTGSNVAGNGSYWYPVSNQGITTSFAEYSGLLNVAGLAFSSNCRTMAPLALLNYIGTAGYMEIQDLRIEEVIPGTLIQDGAITTNKLTASAVTADKILANTITATQIAVSTITGDRIVANTLTANLIDSRGLSIKDAAGNVILAAGTGVDFNTRFPVAYTPGVPANNATSDLVLIGTNVSLSGNTAVKTGGSTNTWDAGVRSKDSAPFGAIASFVIPNTTSYIMFGLNGSDTATDSGYLNIDYAIYAQPGGVLAMYESGAGASSGYTYAAGDVLSVVDDGASIKYLVNGVVTFTSNSFASKLPNKNLFLDSSIYNIGDSITNVQFFAQPSSNFSNIAGTTKPADNASSDLVLVASGMTVQGNTATKTSTSSAWDGSVYTPNGFTNGAFAEVRLTGYTSAFMFGLNQDPTTDNSYTSIDYAWYIDGGTGAKIYESGIVQGGGASFATIAAGDILTVMTDGVNVFYLQNGVNRRTVGISAPNLKMHFDSSFLSTGGSVTNIRFGPMSNNDFSAIGGATKPDNNATVGAVAGTNLKDNAGTVMSTAQVRNGYTENAIGHVARPQGGSYSDGINAAGALQIQLPAPVYNSNTMIHFDVEIYEYATGMSCTYTISGYNYTSGWLNVSVEYTGPLSGRKPVYFGVNAASNRNAIFIGAGSSTIWQYPQFRVVNVTTGYTNYDWSSWDSGWTLSLVSSIPSGWTQLVSQPGVGSAFSRIDQIPAGSASTYIANAAIGNAQIGGIIQSDNFVTGTSGWKIDKTTGSAEFGQITTRGNLIAGYGTGFRSEVSADDAVYALWVGTGTKNDANAIFYIKRTGAAYYAGSLSAGILSTAVQTPDISTTAQIIDGPFGSNGGNINVTVSYTYDYVRTGSKYDFVDGSGTQSVVVTLYRTIGSGTETQVYQTTMTGSLIITNDPDPSAPNKVERVINGSFTYVDTAHVTTDRTFRAVLSSFSNRSYTTTTKNSGGTDFTPTVYQRLGIVTTE